MNFLSFRNIHSYKFAEALMIARAHRFDLLRASSVSSSAGHCSRCYSSILHEFFTERGCYDSFLENTTVVINTNCKDLTCSDGVRVNVQEFIDQT